jgi:serine/threonine-protein kinase
MVLLPLLALVAGAGIAVALLQALADDTGGTPAEAAEQRDSGSIVLDAAQYVGRPVDEVVRQLTRLGLDVQPVGEDRDDVDPDRVTGVEPAGQPLTAGDTVVVRYATGRTSNGGAPDRPVVTGAADGGPAPVPEEEPVPVDEPAPVTTPRSSTPATSVQPGTPSTSRAPSSPTSSTSPSSPGQSSSTTTPPTPPTSTAPTTGPSTSGAPTAG